MESFLVISDVQFVVGSRTGSRCLLVSCLFWMLEMVGDASAGFGILETNEWGGRE